MASRVRPVVTTTGDFGFAGLNLRILSYLTGWLQNLSRPQYRLATSQRWSGRRNILRLLVTSRAFTQDSKPDKEALAIDGTSRLLWRFPPRRLEAEVIRADPYSIRFIRSRTRGPEL